MADTLSGPGSHVGSCFLVEHLFTILSAEPMVARSDLPALAGLVNKLPSPGLDGPATLVALLKCDYSEQDMVVS